MKTKKVLIAVGGHGDELSTAINASHKLVDTVNSLGFEVNVALIDTLISNLNLARQADFVYIVSYGGIGENGGFQSILEENNIPFTGCIGSVSAICKDKFLCKKILSSVGVLVAKGFKFNCLTTNDEIVDKMVAQSIDFPVILKPRFTGGSSIGIQIVNKLSDLKSSLCKVKSYDNQFILEEYIKGTDYIAGGVTRNTESHIFPIGKAKINKDQNFADRFAAGESIFEISTNQEINQKIKNISKKINLFLEITGMSYIDFRVNEKSIPYFIEIGTMYGISDNSILPLSAKAEGIDFSELVKYDIKLATNRERNNDSH